ncbi:S9 family peptidase [Sphingomonas sp. KR3-1]|uniref:alpha/beta hydrolase family protein n=1 Tax=Sphingomonas sp. KR3-1 TaxID=3156611 RepID=UPI0032B60711
MRGRIFKALALAGAAALAGIASAAGPDLAVPTAADLGARPVMIDLVISPDGQHVAAEARRGDKQVILLTEADPAKSIESHVVQIPENFDIRWVRWAGSGKVLISLLTTGKAFGIDMPITRLIEMDVRTTQTSFVGLKELGLLGDDVIYVDPAGGFVLLNAQPSLFDYPAVYRIDLATLKAERVVKAQQGVWSWYADDKGVVRAGVGSEDKKWWVFYRERADQPFERTKRREYDDDDVGIDKFLPLGGSDTGYAVAAGKSGRFGLYKYDFRADAIGDLVYENPEVDIDDFDLKDGVPSAVYFTDDRPQIEWFDPALKKLQARLDHALPGRANRVISRSADDMRLLVLSSSAEDPGTVYFFDRKANRMSPFAALYEPLIGKRLAPMEPVRYQARDGLEVRGYLTLPPGRDAKGLPLIVMPHGGPFARDSWGYDAWVQYLASKGYAVLQPNYRGSTGFGKAFVDKGVGQFGRGMQDDVDDGVKWLAARGTVDAKRVCIMGASYGGYAAMLAAVRNPEIYRCAISFAGLSDVAAQLRYDRKSFAASRYYRNWRDKVRGDKDFELDTISPLKMAEKMTVPILIAHGTKDRTVPVAQSQNLHDALLKLKRPHEFVLYKDEAHGFSNPANATDFLNRVGAFLDKHNPAGL